jgi:hypothetical protein
MSSLLICQLCQLLVCFFGPLTEVEFVAAEDDVTICLEGLTDVAAFYWLTSMVENNP